MERNNPSEPLTGHYSLKADKPIFTVPSHFKQQHLDKFTLRFIFLSFFLVGLYNYQ